MHWFAVKTKEDKNRRPFLYLLLLDTNVLILLQCWTDM